MHAAPMMLARLRGATMSLDKVILIDGLAGPSSREIMKLMYGPVSRKLMRSPVRLKASRDLNDCLEIQWVLIP